jgi:hypothetical protein
MAAAAEQRHPRRFSGMGHSHELDWINCSLVPELLILTYAFRSAIFEQQYMHNHLIDGYDANEENSPFS